MKRHRDEASPPDLRGVSSTLTRTQKRRRQRKRAAMRDAARQLVVQEQRRG